MPRARVANADEPQITQTTVKRYTFADYVFQFITITAGVLIALLVNQVVEVRNNQDLVRQARQMITQELTDNKKELETVLRGYAEREKRYANAVQFADDWLTKKKTTIDSIQLTSETAELNSSSWRSAEGTGAVALMEYAEVKEYTEVYGYQDTFVELNRGAIEQIAEASAMLSSNFNPDNPNLRDLEIFRQHVLRLMSHQRVTKQVGDKLVEAYDRILQR